MPKIPSSLARLLVGSLAVVAVALLLFLASTPYGYPFFLLFLILLQCGAQQEFYHLTKKRTAPLFACLFSAALFLSVSFGGGLFLLPLVALFLLALFFQKGASLEKSALTSFGALYTLLPLVSLLLILLEPAGGVRLVCFTLVATKLADIAALYTGKTVGKTPLAPNISPQKTWEGLGGGIVAAVLGSLFFFPWPIAPPLGAAMALVGLLGDLSESKIKREMQVKDSSTLPGLGGILDILDSLVFTAPLVYLLTIGGML